MKFYYQHYHKYKKIEIPWINEIPDHWKMLKLRNILERVNQKNQPDLPLLSVVRDKGVIKRELSKNDDNHNVIPEDLSNHKVVKIGQFAMNKMKAWQGSYGVSKYEGVVSPAYFIFDVKNVEKDFFHMAIRSKAYIPFFNQSSEGVRVDQWDLSIERMKNVPFFIPPLEEQKAIVRFLDYTDRRIKRYIRAKQKLIKLLEEEKQAIIHKAVTRGLNPDVPMKPSGVEWLGDIPEHWEVLPGKTCFFESKTSNSGLKEQKVLSLSYGKIIVKPEEKLHGLVPTSFETYQIIDKNDIIVRPTDLQNDKVSLRFGMSNQRGIITSAYLCLKTKEKLFPEYGYLFLHCLDINKIIYRLGSGLRQNLSWEDFKYLPILLPSLQEQFEISNFINSSNKKIEEQINQLEKEITLLSEYRTRLIADVVTGKLDVREAAAQLPEELEAEEIDIEEIEVEDEEEQQEALEP